MMKKTTLVCAFALLCGSVFAADYADSKAAVKAARQLEKEKKPAEAVEAYRAAAKLAKTPNEQVDALTRAARLLSNQKKGPEAVKLMLEFAQDTKKPASQRTMAYLECARAVQAPDEKLKYIDAGLALKAGDWTEGACCLQKAEILQRQKKTAEAEALYKQVAEGKYNEITRAAAYTALARIAISKKDYAAAHAYCATIRELGKKRYAFLIADAGTLEVEVYKAEKKWDEAIKIYTEIAANEKISKRARANAIEQIVTIEFENRNNPENAMKALQLYKTYNLPMSNKAKKYEKDIKELTE